MRQQLFRLLLTSCTFVAIEVFPQPANLSKSFQTPPQSAHPQVWWHWMNGNITEDGIRKDLEWMHRIGLGGFHQFDAGTSQTPVMVAHRLSYMHPEWQHAFRYAMGLADSLDMEVTIASAPGWSATGGPWVSEADAMKKLVWRQTVVNGGRKIDLQLPSAYTMAGPYQNMPLGDDLYGTDWKPLSFYRNINVLAVRMPDEECSLADLHPTLTSSSGTFTLQQLTDGDAVTSRPLSNGPDGYCWLQYAFPQPVTIRGMRLAIVSLSSTLFGNIAGHCVLEASNDGKNFHEVQQLGLYVGVMQTRSLPATTARYFRLKIDNPKAFGFLWGFISVCTTGYTGSRVRSLYMLCCQPVGV